MVLDNWVILKITSGDEGVYKVFGTIYGGYLSGDAWKLNSGITRVEEDENMYSFYGASGSCYICPKHTYGTSGYTGGVLKGFIEKAEKAGGEIIILPDDTNWSEIEYNI